jgi:hypothetical protein
LTDAVELIFRLSIVSPRVVTRPANR